MSSTTVANGGRPVYYDLGHLEFGPLFAKVMKEMKEDLAKAPKSQRKVVVYYGTRGHNYTTD